MDDTPLFDADLDTRGQRCPLPVLKARKRMKTLSPGDVLRVQADDPLAQVDVPNFCREDGHHLQATRTVPDGVQFFIKKVAG